ncbi:MAG: phage tail tape measure protein, partial [Psychromonas sp.]|nr:phage tail tape measure protein [Psychromonas sp.]
LAKELKGVANASDELTLSQKELTQMVSKVVDSLKDETLKGKQLKEAKLALRKAAKDSIELDNKVVKTQKDLLKIDDKRSKQIIKNKQLLQDKTKAVKDEIKANKLVKGSLDAMAARIKELNALKKREVVATKEGKTAISKYNKEINKLNKTMTRYASAEGRRTKGIGKYTQHVLKAYAAIMVVVGGVRIMTREFAKSVKVFAQYTLIMSKLRAVSGATGEEMMALKQQARDLGATTEKTATQVGELQVSLSKLGVKPKGIIEATKSILNLSTASGEDLAESGRIAIATLKGFDKPMKDSTKMVDIMAKSFSSSALDLEKYDTAMAKVAPMAALAGDSIEVVTGRMSVLADVSVEASTIGTSLRKMYIKNAKYGITYAEGLDKINNSTDKTTTATELYGERAAAIAVILANNITKTNELTKSYESAGGAAAKMAEIMRDNLQGDFDTFNSAVEGLRLNLMDELAPSLRSVTQFATNFIDGLNKITEVKLSDKLREQNTEVNILMRSLMSSNLTEAETLSLKLKINAINPDLIKGYENTADKVAFLRDRMNEYNTSMERQILLEKLSEDSKDKLAEKAEAFMDMEDEKLKQQGLILEGRKRLTKTQLEEVDNE